MCGRKVQPKGGPVTPISRAFVDLYPVRFEVYICNKKNPLPHPMPSTETKPDKVGLLVLRTSSVLFCPVLSCPVLFYPVLFCPVLSCPILSCSILSYPVLCYPVLSCSILSCSVLCFTSLLSYLPF